MHRLVREAGVGPSRMTKKIAIIGTTPSRSLAPFADDTWEVWTIGPGGHDIPTHRWNRLWEIHGAGTWHTWPVEFGAYLDVISKIKLPQQVVTMRPIREMVQDWGYQHQKTPEDVAKEITGSWEANVVIDRQRIVEKYGRMWLSSSFSWALAQAFEEKVERIGIYGVDLECGEEYISQFAGARHFIDMARTMGVTVEMPRWCGLLRDPNPYPDRWETHEALWMHNRMAMMRNLIAEKVTEQENLKAEIHRMEGASRAAEDITKNHEGKVRDEALEFIKNLDAQRTKRMMDLADANARACHLNGQLASWQLYLEQFIYTGKSGIL